MRFADLFAGGGGATIAGIMAGVTPVLAANHNPLAVETHRLNHPTVEHWTQDLQQADWTQMPDYEVLLAGPSCQGHSTAGQVGRAAKGKTRRHHDALRGTAWSVVDCLDATGPSYFVVENVPEFVNWRLFRHWLATLKALGYYVQLVTVNAADVGVPQLRVRLFVVGHMFRQPRIKIEPVEHRPFGPCIGWNEGEWKQINAMPPRFRKAQARLERAKENHGPRCIVHHGWHGHQGLPLSEPLRTVTTADQWVVVDGERYRSLTVRENERAMGFPAYVWPAHATRKDIIRMLGNAWVPEVGKQVLVQLLGG